MTITEINGVVPLLLFAIISFGVVTARSENQREMLFISMLLFHQIKLTKSLLVSFSICITSNTHAHTFNLM